MLYAVLAVMGAAPLVAAGPSRRPDWRRGGPQLVIGQDAPDFELSPLTFETDANGLEVGRIGSEKVKLSDYKGKAPVCIFSSSYT